jgi:hypothetical protein
MQCKGWLAKYLLKRIINAGAELQLSCDQPEVKLTKQNSAGGRQVLDVVVLPLRMPSGEGTWTWAEVSFIADAIPTSLDVDFRAEIVVLGKPGKWLKHLIRIDPRIKMITVTRSSIA